MAAAAILDKVEAACRGKDIINAVKDSFGSLQSPVCADSIGNALSLLLDRVKELLSADGIAIAGTNKSERAVFIKEVPAISQGSLTVSEYRALLETMTKYAALKARHNNRKRWSMGLGISTAGAMALTAAVFTSAGLLLVAAPAGAAIGAVAVAATGSKARRGDRRTAKQSSSSSAEAHAALAEIEEEEEAAAAAAAAAAAEAPSGPEVAAVEEAPAVEEAAVKTPRSKLAKSVSKKLKKAFSIKDKDASKSPAAPQAAAAVSAAAAAATAAVAATAAASEPAVDAEGAAEPVAELAPTDAATAAAAPEASEEAVPAAAAEETPSAVSVPQAPVQTTPQAPSGGSSPRGSDELVSAVVELSAVPPTESTKAPSEADAPKPMTPTIDAAAAAADDSGDLPPPVVCESPFSGPPASADLPPAPFAVKTSGADFITSSGSTGGLPPKPLSKSKSLTKSMSKKIKKAFSIKDKQGAGSRKVSDADSDSPLAPPVPPRRSGSFFRNSGSFSRRTSGDMGGEEGGEEGVERSKGSATIKKMVDGLRRSFSLDRPSLDGSKPSKKARKDELEV